MAGEIALVTMTHRTFTIHWLPVMSKGIFLKDARPLYETTKSICLLLVHSICVLAIFLHVLIWLIYLLNINSQLFLNLLEHCIILVLRERSQHRVGWWSPLVWNLATYFPHLGYLFCLTYLSFLAYLGSFHFFLDLVLLFVYLRFLRFLSEFHTNFFMLKQFFYRLWQARFFFFYLDSLFFKLH